MQVPKKMATTQFSHPRAVGTVYGIDLYGYIPFVCYLRDDAVSVFTLPEARERNTWKAQYDRGTVFDASMLADFTVEVATFDDPVNIWVGGHWGTERELVGNILVHSAKSKGKPLLARIMQEGQELRVTCNDIAGNNSFSTSLRSDATVANLLHEYKIAMQCVNARCIDDIGTVVAHDLPLKSFASLCLQDGTNTYVYIGPEVFSFESGEEIIAFHSGLCHNGDCEATATTARNHRFIIDCGVLGRAICPCCVDAHDGNDSEDEDPEDPDEDVAMSEGSGFITWASHKKVIHEVIPLWEL